MEIRKVSVKTSDGVDGQGGVEQSGHLGQVHQDKTDGQEGSTSAGGQQLGSAAGGLGGIGPGPWEDGDQLDGRLFPEGVKPGEGKDFASAVQEAAEAYGKEHPDAKCDDAPETQGTGPKDGPEQIYPRPAAWRQ